MAMTKVKGLQMWCQRRTEGYRDVNVRDMTSSWKNGLAFCALIHRFRPDLIDYDSLSKENIFENNQLAFEVAERELGIPALLEAQDMVDIRVPDKLSVVTYVSQYYNYFRDAPQLGGPGVSVAQTSSSANKRSPTVQPAPGPEVKRFAPANEINTGKATPKQPEQPKKTSTIGDKCVICNNKVYLLERQIENGKLYHRSCFRHSELSPTAKVFKSSHSPYSDDFASKAKVRKTEEAPSWAKSNGLSHVGTESSRDESKKSLFPSAQKTSDLPSQSPAKPDPLLERLNRRMEMDKKESEVPSYKKNRPLILQVGSKEPEKDSKTSEPPTPTFNAKKFDKHEFGFLSKNTKTDDTKSTEIKKSELTSAQADLSKPKETQSAAKTSFPVSKPRHFGDKETSKIEKMDTSEPFGAKLKHVSPTAPRKAFTKDNEKTKDHVSGKPKTPPFSKKLVLTHDKSHARESVKTPDSPPPPLPTSQPPPKLASRFSPVEVSAPPIPSSLPPSVPSSKSSHTHVTVSTTKTTTTSDTKSMNKIPHSKITTTTTTTKSILKTKTTSSAPTKPPRLLLAESGDRLESPMDVDEALHRASNPIPGAEPVAVLITPTEKNPVQEKRVLGGLLASLANVRDKKTDDVKSTTDTSSNKNFPVAKSRTDFKSDLTAKTKVDSNVSKSKVELSVSETKVDVEVSKNKESGVTDKKNKSPFSFVSDKVGLFRKDESNVNVDKHSKDGPSSKPSDFPSNRTSAISELSSKYTSKDSGLDSDTAKSKDRQPTSRPEEPAPSWKKDTVLKDQKTNRNVLLQDSKVSSNKTKDSEDVPSWKKDLDKNKAEKSKPKGSDLLLDSKSKAVKYKTESSDQVPSWKQRHNEKDKDQQKSSDLLLDSKSKPRTEPTEDDQTPSWMKALEKRKAEKARPKSADILLLDESKKSEISDRRVKHKDDLTITAMKDRPKSANVLDSEPTGKLSWQMDAERRLAQNKGGFVDPEKKAIKDLKTEKSAPQKKPRTLITNQTDSEPPVPTSNLRVQIKPPSRLPPSPPASPPRALKKISLGANFDFKSATPLGGKKEEPTSPLRTPPPRPPPPKGGNLKTESPGRLSPCVIQRQLDDIDSKLTELELRGRHLEDSIRSVDTTEEEDDMMIEWFKLINSKNELVRKEADLIYISKQQELEDQQEDLDSMLRYLMSIPENEKTEAQKRREEDLLEKKMAIIDQRNNIVDSIDEDRIRYEEEDKDIAIMLEEKGFTHADIGKVEKKKQQKAKPRKGAFVSYTNY